MKRIGIVGGGISGLHLGLWLRVGTYGVLSYMAMERRREIGIRIAPGAARSSVVALVMKQGLQLTLLGVVVGLGLPAWCASRLDPNVVLKAD